MSPPLLSEHIRYNRKVNITFNFKFHKCETKLKSATSHALEPPSSGIKYVTLFWSILPPPLSHFVTHPGAPKSTSHISDPLFLVGLVQQTRTQPTVQILSLVRGGFALGFCHRVFCLEGFVRGGFCQFPLLSEYICYNRKVKHHFKFHVSYVR